MTQITPRFFALPLIALAIILSLPRAAPALCSGEEHSASFATAAPASGQKCEAAPRKIVMTSVSTIVR